MGLPFGVGDARQNSRRGWFARGLHRLAVAGLRARAARSTNAALRKLGLARARQENARTVRTRPGVALHLL